MDYLVKIRAKTADNELLVTYRILGEVGYRNFRKHFMNAEYPYTWLFGHKQSVIWNSLEDFKKSLYVQEMKENEENIITSFFSFQRDWPWPEERQ